MKYIIDKGSKRPAYLQLYEQIRDDITKGTYPLNTKIPSKRILSDETGVSTITVEHAYGLLCDEGYIEPRERSGYFVIFKKSDGFVLSNSSANKVFFPTHPHVEISEEFPFSTLAKAMRGVLNNFSENILDRSPNQGLIELRQAISDYLFKSRGITATPHQIVIGSGAEYLYSLIVKLLGRDKIYAIEYPSYKKIEQVYNTSDVKLLKLPLSRDGIESESLSDCKADLLHISPYRSFPTGVSASVSKRYEYLNWARKNGAVILEDDFESEFSVSKKSEETVFSLSEDDNVIYMNTFSKTLSPSLRVGYMVLPESLTERFNEKLGFYSCTVPTYIQYVLFELISNGDFERHINRIRRKKRRELKNPK